MRRSVATPELCPQSPIGRRSLLTFNGALSVAAFATPVPAIALPAPFVRPSRDEAIDEIIEGMSQLSPEGRDKFIRAIFALHEKDYATFADIADAWEYSDLAAEYRAKMGATH